MRKLSDIYKELNIAFAFPIKIKDAKDRESYYETSDGFWRFTEYGENGYEKYYEDSDGLQIGTPRSS
jgi:hypothetical protein